LEEMLKIEGFHGQTVFLPEELLYYKAQELWVKPWDRPHTYAFGFTQAGVAMVSGFTYLEFIAGLNEPIQERRPVLAVDTYKVSFELYCPVSGIVIYLNQEIEGEAVKVIEEEPYRYPIFALEVAETFDPRSRFIDARAYLQALEEGCVSICGS